MPFPKLYASHRCRMGVMVAKAQTDILSNLLRSNEGDFTSDFARYVLSLHFLESDHRRMAELGEKCNAGRLTQDEREEYEWYVLVGEFLTLMQLKARSSLQAQSSHT